MNRRERKPIGKEENAFAPGKIARFRSAIVIAVHNYSYWTASGRAFEDRT